MPCGRKRAVRPLMRRIYIGDVPTIVDETEKEVCVKKVVYQRQRRCFRLAPLKANLEESESVSLPIQRRSTKVKQESVQREKFPDNSITTSRYNVWNFVPKNLFEQFRRLVNFYFLIGALINSVVDSPVHPFTSVTPLTFVILVTAIKQGYEDWLRHKNDEQVNNRLVKVVRKCQLQEIKSKDIQVGDIIMLESDEQVPTDLLLLASSDEYLRCQLNTANLDGETNLKLKYCPSGLPHFKAPEDFDGFHAVIECEHPGEHLYEFSGSLLLPVEKLCEMRWSHTEATAPVSDGHLGDGPASSSQNEHIENLKSSGVVRQSETDFVSIPLSMEHVVLRGTRLKNTEFLYGIVIYTGRDTRLAMNSRRVEAKFSTVESRVNIYLMLFVVLLAFIVLFCSIMHYTINWFGSGVNPWYVHKGLEDSPTEIWNHVASYFILFNYLIPISLNVTIEFQKFLGSKFFVWDADMVDEEGKEPLCNTSDLNEELGQIEYLFSDKTGTLTKNLMEFRHCSIESQRYQFLSDDHLYLFNATEPTIMDQPLNVQKVPEVLHFFRVLALCHSVQVVPKKRKSSAEMLATCTFSRRRLISDGFQYGNNVVTPGPSRYDAMVAEDVDFDLEYQASSPDEKALLQSCQALGIVYIGEKEDMLTLRVVGTTEKYKRLMHLEFDADRKCMSVIVENDQNEIWLYTKGAESTIIPRCATGPTQETLKHVTDFALMGLRTLAVSQRKLSRAEWDQFNADLRAARRMIKNRQVRVREIYSCIENKMCLLGATGVEDQLQDYVPETLQALAVAGIRVWMLTGDKLETGINVAISCGLITVSTKLYIISQTTSPIDIVDALQKFKEEIDPTDNTCLAIDGESLAVALTGCPELLRDVSMAALRVVCCRMAPLQKAQVVQMVRNSPSNPVCCAVGDGANDCAMIQCANIGIGILGKEGRQAARCADFALAKFAFIQKAILVHGHFYYVRLANLANYFFYKNLALVMPQLLYCFHNSFSSQTLFVGIYLMSFNIFFTAFPVFIYALSEQPFSSEILMSHPDLYRRNTKNSILSFDHFLPWMFSALWHPVICYYFAAFAWDNFQDLDSVEGFGTCVFTALLFVVNSKILIETRCITVMTLVAQMGSYGAWFLVSSLSSEVNMSPVIVNDEFDHVFYSLMACSTFWLLLWLTLGIAIFPDMAVNLLRNIRRYSDVLYLDDACT